MNALEKRRRKRVFWIAASVILLLVLIVGAVLSRPSAEEKTVRDFSEVILQRGQQSLTGEEELEMRRQWEKFSPETRRTILLAVSRQRLDQFRQETAQLSPEERRGRIQEAIQQMRRHQETITEEQRQQIRVRFDSAEGRETVRQTLLFYQTELTAPERAELDPLVHEWLYQAERLFQK